MNDFIPNSFAENSLLKKFISLINGFLGSSSNDRLIFISFSKIFCLAPNLSHIVGFKNTLEDLLIIIDVTALSNSSSFNENNLLRKNPDCLSPSKQENKIIILLDLSGKTVIIKQAFKTSLGFGGGNILLIISE